MPIKPIEPRTIVIKRAIKDKPKEPVTIICAIGGLIFSALNYFFPVSRWKNKEFKWK